MKRAAVVLLGLSMVCILCSCVDTGVTQDKSGGHDIQISGSPPVPFSSGNGLQAGGYTTPEGVRVYTYRGNGYDIRLEDEVLTVNGNRYLIPHKGDSIKVHNGRVWINGQQAKPEPDVNSVPRDRPAP